MTNGSQSPLVALTEEIGEHQLNVLIMQFSESIVEDADLEVAFKGMDAEALSEHMTNLIKMVFGYSCKASMVNPNIRGQIVLRNYALFELGLTRAQLDKLLLYFEDAMADSLVQGEVFDHCSDRFMDLCRMFEAESRSFRQTTFDMNDPAMIMMARAASVRTVAPRAA